MIRVGKKRTHAGYTIGNSICLLQGGKDYFDRLLDMIRKSQLHIHLQTYIFEDDETGRMVSKALGAAAARGVRVFILLDGYGSQDLSHEFIDAIKSKGIQFRWFEPLFRSRHFYFGRRMHHKIVVCDGLAAMVGGVNISDRYNDRPDKPAWLDWALYAEGEAAAELYYVCRDMWNKSGWGRQFNKRIKEKVKPQPVDSVCPVRLRANDWVNRKIQINRSYLEMFRKAGSHIYIMSSYFLPGVMIRRSMSAAARRGVKIRIIVAGKSDVPIAAHAERYMWRWILKNGIELYEYQPTVLHGKLSTYDGQWMTVGSYNVNNISAFASIELNLDVNEPRFVKEVEIRLEDIIRKNCLQITASDLARHSSFAKRFWQKTCYELVRFIFKLFTFYFRQRE